MAKSASKFNVYETVTDTIVKAVKAGTLPWQKPWTGGAGLAMPLRSCGTPYRGINGPSPEEVLITWPSSPDAIIRGTKD